jgi:hypothetical protein
VVSVDRAFSGGYIVKTGTHEAAAKKVVIAVPPVAFPYIKGDVIADIASKQQFKDIIGVEVVTVTQWWPTDWWTQIKDPGANAQVWRAWTTEHCMTFMEVPLDAYGKAQMATRSVYDDDRNCVEFWKETASHGNAAVEAEIKRGLTHMFINNGVSSPSTVTIPDPIRTHVQFWPAAWHWLRAGTSYTNADIFQWATEPLGASENVALVGEAYNPQRSGWSDGAYKSSINLLNKKYGLSLPLPRTVPSLKHRGMPRSRAGN